MSGLDTRPLDAATWPDFAALVEAHRGVWGGCWCMAFHAEGIRAPRTAAQNRADKAQRVAEGRAHAALVYADGRCVGWCQFGSVDEIPRTPGARAYRAGAGPRPDWRLPCFFVDRAHRGRGVATAALAGALAEIARLGGGVVEAYPEELGDRRAPPAFLHAGTLALFERAGFERIRPLGKHRWLVTRTASGA